MANVLGVNKLQPRSETGDPACEIVLLNLRQIRLNHFEILSEITVSNISHDDSESLFAVFLSGLFKSEQDINDVVMSQAPDTGQLVLHSLSGLPPVGADDLPSKNLPGSIPKVFRKMPAVFENDLFNLSIVAVPKIADILEGVSPGLEHHMGSGTGAFRQKSFQ